MQRSESKMPATIWAARPGLWTENEFPSETIWPIVEPMLRSGDHETVFRVLEGEYDRHFASVLGVAS